MAYVSNHPGFSAHHIHFEEPGLLAYQQQPQYFPPSATIDELSTYSGQSSFSLSGSWPSPPDPAAQQTLRYSPAVLTGSAHHESFTQASRYHAATPSAGTQTPPHDCLSPEHDLPLSPESNLQYSDSEHTHMHTGQTIAMTQVQIFADSPDYPVMEVDQQSMPYYAAQEGFMPMQDGPVHSMPYHEAHDHDHDRTPYEETPVLTSSPAIPVLRQRRAAPRPSISRTSTGRVAKRSSRRSLPSPAASETELDQSTQRPFPCPLAPYGCQATFGSKNEWKRHLSTQHLRLEYWRCDQCPHSQSKKPNDFNRRDLFTQHVRRMHIDASSSASRRSRKPPRVDVTEREIQDAAARCNVKLRTPPQRSICVICRQQFSGHGSWDERMEHIGKHFEAVKREGADSAPTDVESWAVDEDVERWMIAEHILTPSGQLTSMSDEA